jgi:hypothetical protein
MGDRRPAGSDAGGPAGSDDGGPAGVDEGGPAGSDDGGPAGMDDGGPLVTAWLWPSDVAEDTAWVLSVPVVDASVARLEMVSPLPTEFLVVNSVPVVVVVESSVPAFGRPPLPGSSLLWTFGPGTLIPILASTAEAVS